MNGAFYGIKEAQIFVVNLPPCRALGQFGGFDMWLQDRSGAGYETADPGAQHPAGQGRAEARSPGRRASERAGERRSCSCTWTACRRSRWACRCRDVYSTIQLMLAPVYVKRLLLRRPYQARDHAGRWPVPHRPGVAEELLQPLHPDPERRWHQRDDPAQHGGQVRMGVGTAVAEPLHGYSAINIVGSQAPGTSSGEAMQTMESIVNDDLPAASATTGPACPSRNPGRQCRHAAAGAVHRCGVPVPGSLYESWSIPVAVMLVVPLACWAHWACRCCAACPTICSSRSA